MKLTRKRAFGIALCALVSASCARRTSPRDYSADANHLQRLLEDFADDSMLGRSALTLGHDRAAAYLAREAMRAGLEPAGDSGTWFQTLHLFARRLSPGSRILLGDVTLMPVRDFKVFPVGAGQPRSIAGARIVYGGIVGDSTTQIDASTARGRVVLLGIPTDMTPQRVYQNVSYSATSRFGGAVAVAIASLDFLPPAQRAITTATGPADGSAPPAYALPSAILVTREAAALMLGRPLHDAAPGTMGRVLSGGLLVEERDIPTRNVVAVLRGSDRQLAATYVAVGAHSDHVGMSTIPFDHDSVRAIALVRQRGKDAADEALVQTIRDSLTKVHRPRRDSVYNGADDDGSGSVALLEVARVLAGGPRPLRSVLFVWHAAEEDGLLGSRWFVDHPLVPLDSIIAQVNLDMVGRGTALDTDGGGPRYLQVLGSTRRSTSLWSLIARVNGNDSSSFSIDTADTQGLFCRSDHWSYARHGIPVAFLTTGLHIDYHAVSDESQYIDFAKLASVTRFTANVLRALANERSRLPATSPAPDTHSFCRG
jgi:hypothetical protein